MAQQVGEERYYDLAEDTIEALEGLIQNSISSPIKVNYIFQGDRKLKQLIKVSKITDKYAYKLNSPVLVEVNQNIWDAISHEEETITILFQDAFAGLKIDGSTGKVSYKEDGFKASKGVLQKWDYPTVARAKELVELTLDQMSEQEEQAVQEIDISA